tara:strand:- start:164 stop:601 length:438 start_codon:yes stop_codon:yes gene_type:complete
MHLLLLNGPNLNLLGEREPGLYGRRNLDFIEGELRAQAEAENVQIDCFQSNFEGALVERIHKAMGISQGILINAGAYTHTSIAIRDALLGVSIPFVEIHISNIDAREDFRHRSYLSDRAVGMVSGFGSMSYSLAFRGLIHYLQNS